MLAAMELNYRQKANLILKDFGVYGVGHFDLTAGEIAKLLELLDKDDAKELVREFYEQLNEKRMG